MALNNVVSLNPDAETVTFEKFWSHYPRRVAKVVAQRAWLKVDPRDHQKLMAALEMHRQHESWKEDGGKYIPHAATWLNQRRWEDELDGDLSMGECCWNRNGTREPGKPKCNAQGTTEKAGIVYCANHARLV